jgi:hypothetical protein
MYNINSRAYMIAPNGNPVICEELAWKDVDTLDKIVNFIATKLVKFLIVIVFVQKK